MEKRTAITYIDSDGNWHRASKGAPEQVMNVSLAHTVLVGIFLSSYFMLYSLFICACLSNLHQIIELCNLKDHAKKKAHAIIDKFADRGLRSLAVSQQVSLYFFLTLNCF